MQRIRTWLTRAAVACLLLVAVLALVASRADACDRERAPEAPHDWSRDDDRAAAAPEGSDSDRARDDEGVDEPDDTYENGDADHGDDAQHGEDADDSDDAEHGDDAQQGEDAEYDHDADEPDHLEHDDDGFDRTATQDAEVHDEGVAVADTGGNVVVAGDDRASVTTTGKPKTASTAATANVADAAVEQRATAQATAEAKVDILQIALVVNVGTAHAGTGGNVPAPTASAGPALQTGNATAVGQAARTDVVQSAVIGRGARSDQSTTVVNIGVAVANTGLNVAAGGKANAAASTGDAVAVGNITWTGIDQRASGFASGTATLTIDQRAVVLNVGTAFANSGGNVVISPAGDATNDASPILRAVWAILAPLFETPTLPTSTSGASGGISTGTAVAVGNVAATDVLQSATGRVSGSGVAAAHQVAAVGNVGLAFANTGLNGALGARAGPAATPTRTADDVARVLLPLTSLDWLEGPNPFAQLTANLDVEGALLDLVGHFHGGALERSGVRVRQITGVVDVGIAHLEPAADAATATATVPPAAPAVRTGDATALGNHATVTVCQTLNADDGCVRRAPVRHPSRAGGVGDDADVSNASDVADPQAAAPRPAPQTILVVTQRVPHAGSSTTLPTTGSDTSALATIGVALLGGGALLVLSARTARRHRTGRR